MIDSSTIEIAVAIPVYNSHPFLERAVESVLAQTDSHWTLYLLDDGSTDPRIIRALENYSKHPKIRVKSHANQGGLKTRNHLLNWVNEPWIAWLDHDDEMNPERIKRQREVLGSKPNLVALGSWIEFIDEDSKVIGRRRYPVTDQEVREALPLINPIANPSVVLNVSVVKSLGGIVGHWGADDYETLLLLAKKGRVENIPEFLTRYRLHTAQHKYTQTRDQLRATINIKLQMKKFGYPRGLKFWLRLTAECALMVLPQSFVSWLFKKLNGM
ncbi:MAG: glycosyltransferase family 2 protein [Xanthomonadaceae bacterium]|nr:glycosyltransferase family 2 protein [Xanthomonadaceae bacterium]